MNTSMHDVMEAIFYPKSVALVGVPSTMKIGRFFLLALLSMGYAGKIYPVNPTIDEIDGLPVYHHTRDIPEPLDLAIVLVSRRHLDGVIDELGVVGTKAAVIFTAGLGELGKEGTEAQNELVSRAHAWGIRLIGPNCQGVHAPEVGLSFFPHMPNDVGDISFLSGSGSLASLSIMRAASQGLFFNKVISFGNAADLVPSDFLSYFADDQKTAVIVAYIEGIPEGRRFFDTLVETTPKKPVIVWKAGLTESGEKAAASHTGALTGDACLWESALAQAGAVEAQSIDDVIDTVMALRLIPSRSGDRVAIVSGPGGLAVAAADHVDRVGLTLAPLSEKTRREIATLLPDAGISTKNPVDVGLGASGDPTQYTEPVRILMDDENVDAVVVIGGTFSAELNEIFINKLIETKKGTKKNLLVVDLPEFKAASPEGEGLGARFISAGVPAFPSHERALNAYKKVCEYGEFLVRKG
jgi:acyl-CoA synthetase (NDP forming)